MTSGIDEAWLREMIAGAIRAAIADPGSAAGDGRSRSDRFISHLREALHAAARARFPYEPDPVRTEPFLWDIFVGQYGADETGAPVALIRGLWAVECELDPGRQRDFNKLMVAQVDHRLFILPTGTRSVSGLQTQCRVAKVPCWVAEVDPVDRWSAAPEYVPWVKLQRLPTGR